MQSVVLMDILCLSRFVVAWRTSCMSSATTVRIFSLINVIRQLKPRKICNSFLLMSEDSIKFFADVLPQVVMD